MVVGIIYLSIAHYNIRDTSIFFYILAKSTLVQVPIL